MFRAILWKMPVFSDNFSDSCTDQCRYASPASVASRCCALCRRQRAYAAVYRAVYGASVFMMRLYTVWLERTCECEAETAEYSDDDFIECGERGFFSAQEIGRNMKSIGRRH